MTHCWHLRCAGLAGRHALLVDVLPRLELAGPWYFVDLPAPDGPWIELAAPLPAGPDALAGAVLHAVPVAESAILATETCPEDQLTLRDGLAIGSARACGLLAALAAERVHTALTDELAQAHAALRPDPASRRFAALWHALWLAGATGRDDALRAAASSPAPASAPRIHVTPPWRPLPGLAPRDPEDVARAALLARILHIHALRLLGPAHPDPIAAELAALFALVTALA